MILDYRERPGYAVVEWNRPPANVLTMELLEELRRAFARAAASAARGLLLRGSGKCFSAGADVSEHLPGKVEAMLPLFTRTVLDLLTLDIPTAAYVHGSALGGGFELALACDFRVADENARFGLPEIQLGVFPPVAAVLLPQTIARSRAMEMLLTGDSISARDAADAGLTRIGAVETAESLLDRIAAHPVPAVATCKRAARERVVERITLAERAYLDDLMKHPEPVEGLRAFLEKRPPAWRNTR